MFKLFRFFKGLYLMGRRRTEDELRQKAEGYSVKFEQYGPERSITYVEGEREINVIEQFSWTNDVVVFTDSLKRWSRPYNEPVSDFEYQKIVNRLIRYFSCWGGNVTLDDRRLPTAEDFIRGLEESGIPYEQLPGGIIKYAVDIEAERKRKGGFFDR